MSTKNKYFVTDTEKVFCHIVTDGEDDKCGGVSSGRTAGWQRTKAKADTKTSGRTSRQAGMVQDVDKMAVVADRENRGVKIAPE